MSLRFLGPVMTCRRRLGRVDQAVPSVRGKRDRLQARPDVVLGDRGYDHDHDKYRRLVRDRPRREAADRPPAGALGRRRLLTCTGFALLRNRWRSATTSTRRSSSWDAPSSAGGRSALHAVDLVQRVGGGPRGGRACCFGKLASQRHHQYSKGSMRRTAVDGCRVSNPAQRGELVLSPTCDGASGCACRSISPVKLQPPQSLGEDLELMLPDPLP